MSFYTALTGLNGSQADIDATSNNIANVATTGYKRSRAEFGDKSKIVKETICNICKNNTENPNLKKNGNSFSIAR